MNYKFTSDGRKVVIVGVLNSKETIVQEVFVTDGTEFPAGEHFVVKTLLDVPAETYKASEEKRAEQRIEKLKREQDNLSRAISDMRLNLAAVGAKFAWAKGITDPEIEAVFDRVKDFISGRITHILYYGYGRLKIEEVGVDAFAKYECGRNTFNGIRLLSLFGEWNGRLAMDWRLNEYRDGSGSWAKCFPCKSLEEAVQKAKEIINAQEHLSDSDHAFCIKYKIPIDENKNAKRLSAKTESIKKMISESKKQISKLEDSLAAIS